MNQLYQGISFGAWHLFEPPGMTGFLIGAWYTILLVQYL